MKLYICALIVPAKANHLIFSEVVLTFFCLLFTGCLPSVADFGTEKVLPIKRGTLSSQLIIWLQQEGTFSNSLTVFILLTHWSVWTNLGKHLYFVWLCVSRIMRADELPFVVRRSRRISKESSSRSIMRIVSVFILETHTDQAIYKCLPKFVHTDNASLVQKRP